MGKSRTKNKSLSAECQALIESCGFFVKGFLAIAACGVFGLVLLHAVPVLFQAIAVLWIFWMDLLLHILAPITVSSIENTGFQLMLGKLSKIGVESPIAHNFSWVLVFLLTLSFTCLTVVFGAVASVLGFCCLREKTGF